MATEYKLPFTATEVEEKLGKVDNIGWNDLKDRPFYKGDTEKIICPQIAVTLEGGDSYSLDNMPFLVIGGFIT